MQVSFFFFFVSGFFLFLSFFLSMGSREGFVYGNLPAAVSPGCIPHRGCPEAMAVRAPRILPGTSTINSETLIEIQTITPGAVVYFTVDGSKPDIRKRAGARSDSTLKFTHPFKVVGLKDCPYSWASSLLIRVTAALVGFRQETSDFSYLWCRLG